MKQDDPDAVARVERETWNRSAALYIDSTAKFTRHAVDLLIEAGRFTGESRVLEVGCGPGHITKMMADTGPKVTGVDLAPGMVEVASGLYLDIEFKEANAEHLPFDADTFDVVLINQIGQLANRQDFRPPDIVHRRRQLQHTVRAVSPYRRRHRVSKGRSGAGNSAKWCSPAGAR